MHKNTCSTIFVSGECLFEISLWNIFIGSSAFMITSNIHCDIWRISNIRYNRQRNLIKVTATSMFQWTVSIVKTIGETVSFEFDIMNRDNINTFGDIHELIEMLQARQNKLLFNELPSRNLLGRIAASPKTIYRCSNTKGRLRTNALDLMYILSSTIFNTDRKRDPVIIIGEWRA